MSRGLRIQPRHKTRADSFVPGWSICSELAIAPGAGKVLFSANPTGLPSLWSIPLPDGGPMDPLASADGLRISSLAVHPDGTVYFGADQNGDECYAIYRLRPGGTPECLLAAEGVQHLLDRQSLDPSGRYLAFGSNRHTIDSIQVFLLELATGALRCLTPTEGNRLPAGWSPDGRQLLITHAINNADTQLEAYDLASGQLRALTSPENNTAPGPWALDSEHVYVITDSNQEHAGLKMLALANGSMMPVATPDADVELAAVSPDGRWLGWTTNTAGREQLCILDTTHGDSWSPGISGVFEDLLFTPTGELLAVLTTAREPLGIFRFQPARRTWQRLSLWLLPEVNPQSLVEPELVQFQSVDNLTIHAFLYRPARANHEHPAPVVISLHGGPEEQEKAGYNPFYQALLASGIGVLAPNVRGSSGFGGEFQRLVYRDWGGGDVQDVIQAHAFLGLTPWVDRSRVALMGASYGGFLALATACRRPDLWAAVVDLFGPTNLLSLVENVPPTWQQATRQLIGDPQRDAALLLDRSPLTHCHRLRSPLLVIHGSGDSRVPRSESDRLVDAVRLAGGDVEYLILDGEGHGILELSQQSRVLRTVLRFLKTRLGASRRAP